MKIIGIREEDKYVAERRVAVTPEDARNLMAERDVEIQFVPSKKRCFTDEEFVNAGCKPDKTLSDADIIVGVKEIPNPSLEENKTYLFFSHTIKGQAYNMKMLQRMMDLKCNLIDYERVVDDNNRRLIFFGRYAGLAGAINSLWSLGLRFKEKGMITPFEQIQQAVKYHSLDDAKKVIKKAGDEIEAQGLSVPLVIGITGYGNVSQGAQEIISLLPTKEITPDQLLSLSENTEKAKTIYKVVFKEEDLYQRKDKSPFDLQHFYQNPEAYESKFEIFTPHLTMLINCIYWDSKCDRIVTKEFLRENWKKPHFKLEVIGDITCDPNGSVEATHMGTEIENPIFVYHPESETPTFGYQGEGILIMAVDILPSELPRDSSIAFSKALSPFLSGIVDCDFSRPFEELQLPAPIKKALILHHGELTPDYRYIAQYLNP